MPTKIPMIKQYNIDGINYLEISYLVNNKVEHIQIREGYPPHFTEFDWIPKEQYSELLSPWDTVDLLRWANAGKACPDACGFPV